MATMTGVGVHASPERRAGGLWTMKEMWGTIAIVAIWLAVLFDAVFGPDFVSTQASSVTRIPSAVLVAFFAFLATGSVAKRAYGRPSPPEEPHV